MSSEESGPRLRRERYLCQLNGIPMYLEIIVKYGGPDDGVRPVTGDDVPANMVCREIVGCVPIFGEFSVTGVLELEGQAIGFMLRDDAGDEPEKPWWREVMGLGKFDLMRKLNPMFPWITEAFLERIQKMAPQKSHVVLEISDVSGIRARVCGWSCTEKGVRYGIETEVRYRGRRMTGLGGTSWRFVTETEDLFPE